MIESMLRRHGRRGLGFTYRFAASVLKPPMTLITRRDWEGEHWLRQDYPPHDGVVIVANHLSWFDPITLAHILWNNGRPPRFLAKEALFDLPGFGALVRNMGQIPVFRETTNAADAVRAAVDAVHDGEAVVIYPEGTITRDPDLWPMTGRTGAARIALIGGAPVIPIAQWGPQEVMAPYAKEFNIFPPKVMRMRVGAPVDLDDLRSQGLSGDVLNEATRRIMDALTAELESIRGETAPEERVDYRKWRADNEQKERGTE